MQFIPPFDLLSLKENLFWNQTSLSTPQRRLIIYDYNVLCLQTKFESRLVFSVFIFFQNICFRVNRRSVTGKGLHVWTILNIWFTFVSNPTFSTKLKRKGFSLRSFCTSRQSFNWLKQQQYNPKRKSSKSSLVWYDDLKPLAWIIKENFSVDRRI